MNPSSIYLKNEFERCYLKKIKIRIFNKILMNLETETF